MNAVGIDVSKGKSMVTILRPFGEIVSSPFEIKHTSSDIHSLSNENATRSYSNSAWPTTNMSTQRITLLFTYCEFPLVHLSA